jgi:hypothetical protein
MRIALSEDDDHRVSPTPHDVAGLASVPENLIGMGEQEPKPVRRDGN